MSFKNILVQTDPPPKTRRGLPRNLWGEWLVSWENVDDVAKQLGVTPLSQFMRPLSPDERATHADFLARLRGQPFERPPRQPWEPPWFDPADGLATTRALMGFVRENPKGIQLVARLASQPTEQIPGAIMAELEALEKNLLAAAKRGARFHLEVNG
jgi:hypothetical protein